MTAAGAPHASALVRAPEKIRNRPWGNWTAVIYRGVRTVVRSECRSARGGPDGRSRRRQAAAARPLSARLEPDEISRPPATGDHGGGLVGEDTGDGEACRPAKFAPETTKAVAAVEASLSDDDYDNVQQRAMAENLARREADRELISVLAKVGFTGPAQEMFEAELAAYGYPVMMAWTRTGEIIRRCAQKGRPLGITDTGAGWSRDDRCELSTETVARALDFFRTKVLIPGTWDHTRGATIKTYFVGACLFQFPNVYHRWDTERRNWQARCTPVIDDPDDPAGLHELPSGDSTEGQALARRELQLVMADLEENYPDLRRIVGLELQGYTDAQAAAELGISARAIEGQWYRYRCRRERRNGEEEGETHSE